MAQYSREPKLTRRLQADTRGLPFLRLPKALIVAMGWQRGDAIQITLTGRGTLELRKVGKKTVGAPISQEP